MGKHMKSMAHPYLTLFGIALIVAVLARIGLFAMDVSGALAYDYISASNVGILDVICSILTGSAFVAFLFVAGLVLTLSTAGVALYGLLYARNTAGAGHIPTAFLWGWATALMALVCALIVGSGILSAVQVGSMSSKLPSLPVLLAALVVFAAFIGTLLGAASLTVCACIARAKEGRGLGKDLLLATTVCGLIVMALTVGTFSVINSPSIELASVGLWLGVDLVANVVIMVGASAIMHRAAAPA